METTSPHTLQGYALSPVQRRIWDVLPRIKGPGLVARSRVSGELSMGNLNAALELLGAKYNLLRFNFVQNATLAYPLQQESDVVNYSLETEDLTGLGEAHRAELLDTKVMAWTEQGIDTDASALQLLHIRTTESTSELLIRSHPLLMDLRSLQLFVVDLARACNGLSIEAEEENLPYENYAQWQDELLQEPESEGINYWQRLKDEQLDRNALPWAKAMPASVSLRRVKRSLSAKALEGLKAKAQELGIELNTLLTGLFAKFIYGFDRQESLVLGLSRYERIYDELRHAMGAMTKTLPLFLRPDAADKDFFAQLSEEEETLVDWEDFYSMENTGQAADAVMAYGFTHLPQQSFEAAGEQIRFEIIDLSDCSEPCQLRLLTQEHATELVCDLYYAQESISREQADWLADRWVEFTEQKLGLPMQQSAALIEGSSIATDSRLSVLDLFRRQVAAQPEATAVVYKDKVLSFADLDACSNKLARVLQEQYDIKSGSRVAVLLDRSHLVPVAIWAVIKTGAAYVPIDTAYPEDRIEQILDGAQCTVILSTPDSIDNPDFVPSAPVLNLQGELMDGISDAPVEAEVGMDDLVYLIFTSGSTGTPKGVMISHANLSNYVQWSAGYYFPQDERGNWGLMTSLAFDLTVTALFLSTCRGQQLVIGDKDKSVAQLLMELNDPAADYPVDIMKLTPSHVTMMHNLGLERTAMSKVILGGEALEMAQVKALSGMNPAIEIYNEYGPTEATVGCVVKQVTASDERILIGDAVSNTSLCILGADRQPVIPGMLGELYIGGDCLAQGYLGKPELTGQVFGTLDWDQSGSRWYKSGDLVRQTPTGELEYLGRVDKQIKIRGFRIEPAEIQAAIAKVADGCQAHIVVMEREGEKSLLAFVRHSGPVLVQPEELHAGISRLLPAYMVPAHIIPVEQFPLTTNGKTDDKALLAVAEKHLARAERTYVAPVTPGQKKLQALWQEVLGIEEVSITDDFFRMGGNSLSFSQLILKVRQHMGIKVSFKDFFEYTTLEAQADYLSRAEMGGEQEQQIALAPEQQEYPLSPGQLGIWKASQAEASNIAYNMPIIFRIEGALDQAALRKAVAELVARHESLRTVFVQPSGSEVRQRILDGLDLAAVMEQVEVPAYSTEESLADDFLAAIRRPFDLAGGPLMRFTTFEAGAESAWVLFNMHHIIGDNWTMKLFFHQLFKGYLALAQGAEPELISPAIQYKDYTVWLQELLAGKEGQAMADYWKKQFATEPEVLRMPTDMDRSAQRTHEGVPLVSVLDQEATRILRDFTQAHEGTLFMSIMVLLNAVFHKYTGQEDITIGSPIAGREHSDLQEMIGLFVNTLALRNQFGADDSIDTLYRTIRENTLEAYANQLYPFDSLMEQLSYSTEPGRSPLFDVMAVLQNVPYKPEEEVPDTLSITELKFDWGSAKYDFCFFFVEDEDQIRIHLEYDRHLYEERSVQGLLDNIAHVLSQLPEAESLSALELQVSDDATAEEDAFLSQMMGM